MSCQGSSQVTDFASLASALARFGKVGREATNQKVESSSPSGRTIYPLKLALSCSDQARVAIGFTVVLPASKADSRILEALRQMVRGFHPHRQYQTSRNKRLSGRRISI
jgi:hypothetical protein